MISSKLANKLDSLEQSSFYAKATIMFILQKFGFSGMETNFECNNSWATFKKIVRFVYNFMNKDFELGMMWCLNLLLLYITSLLTTDWNNKLFAIV